MPTQPSLTALYPILWFISPGLEKAYNLLNLFHASLFFLLCCRIDAVASASKCVCVCVCMWCVCVSGVFDRWWALPWVTPPPPALQMDILQRGRRLPLLAPLDGYISTIRAKSADFRSSATSTRRLPDQTEALIEKPSNILSQNSSYGHNLWLSRYL